MRLLWSKTENTWLIDLEDGQTPDLHVQSVAIVDSAGDEIGVFSVERGTVPGTLSQTLTPVITLHSAESLKILVN